MGRWTDTQKGVCPQQGMWFSLEEGRESWPGCYSLDEPWGYAAEWNKPVTKRPTRCGSTYGRYSEELYSHRQTAEWGEPGPGRGEWGVRLDGYRASVLQDRQNTGMNGGDSYTTVRTHLITTEWCLGMVQMVSSMLCAFCYQNNNNNNNNAKEEGMRGAAEIMAYWGKNWSGFTVQKF